MMNTSTKSLTAGAIFVALSTVLSLLVVYRLPYGGSITALCMLPVCLYSYRYGLKWGLLAGCVLGVLQMLLGAGGAAFAGMQAIDLMLMVLLDYILAYTCLGLTALARGRFRHTATGVTVGILLATFARLLCHTLSGFILFRGYAEWYFSQDGFAFGGYVLEHMSGAVLSWFYALFYNASFLVPETVLTLIGGALLLPVLKRYLTE